MLFKPKIHKTHQLLKVPTYSDDKFVDSDFGNFGKPFKSDSERKNLPFLLFFFLTKLFTLDQFSSYVKSKSPLLKCL